MRMLHSSLLSKNWCLYFMSESNHWYDILGMAEGQIWTIWYIRRGSFEEKLRLRTLGQYHYFSHWGYLSSYAKVVGFSRDKIKRSSSSLVVIPFISRNVAECLYWCSQLILKTEFGNLCIVKTLCTPWYINDLLYCDLCF